MKSKVLAVIIGLFVLAAAPIMADEGGVKDTLDMVITIQPDAGASQLNVQLELYGFVDFDTLNAISVGFDWDNPKLHMTAATPTSAFDAAFSNPIFYDSDLIDSTNHYQRFQCIAIRLFTPGWHPNPNRQLFVTYDFVVDNSWTTSDVIHIDTFSWSSGTNYKFVSSTGGDYYPYWSGVRTITDVNPSIPKNIEISEDSLFFVATEGGSNPPSQTFDVSSDGDNFDFTVEESVSWLLKSPSAGTTPQTVTVSVSMTGLSAGVYFDSLAIVSSSAANSPQYVYVTFTLEEPPPTIGISQGTFFFNAIAGEADPAPQTLSISNTGGSTLNWTVTNSESWLDLFPTSGTDDGDVTLSVDITGLPFGEYFDTVVVSDPAATNDPVKVAVTLSVASDLPTIGVTPANKVVVIELDEVMTQKEGIYSFPPESLLIENVSLGSMTFYTEETSSHLDSVLPASGTAPANVEVYFSFPEGVMIGDYYDTLWVYSNEAINSPVPVEFRFHVVYNAAEIAAQDTVKLDMFECILGSVLDIPSKLISIANSGGDPPMYVDIEYESDLFTVNVSHLETPGLCRLKPIAFDLPVGTYYDTIIISSPNAINSPFIQIVQYNVVPGVEPPEIYIADNYPFTIPAQSGSAPFYAEDFVVKNLHGGCMDWELQGDVDWATPGTTSGIIPGYVDLLVDASSLPFGEYRDTLTILSTSAANSPLEVELLLRVWVYRGDANFDNSVDISDIVYLIRYLYLHLGPPPQPEMATGDPNCDDSVDISDITYLIKYLYLNGDPPCAKK